MTVLLASYPSPSPYISIGYPSPVLVGLFSLGLSDLLSCFSYLVFDLLSIVLNILSLNDFFSSILV